MSQSPAITISSAFGDVFVEGTIQFKNDDLLGWRAVRPYPGPEISVSLFWQKSGTPIANPSRLANVRKHIIPMLKASWEPAQETTDA